MMIRKRAFMSLFETKMLIRLEILKLMQFIPITMMMDMPMITIYIAGYENIFGLYFKDSQDYKTVLILFILIMDHYD